MKTVIPIGVQNHIIGIVRTVCTFLVPPDADGMILAVRMNMDTYVKEVRKLDKNALLWRNIKKKKDDS